MNAQMQDHSGGAIGFGVMTAMEPQAVEVLVKRLGGCCSTIDRAMAHEGFSEEDIETLKDLETQATIYSRVVDEARNSQPEGLSVLRQVSGLIENFCSLIEVELGQFAKNGA